ncbi:desulfoferrodoxin [Candidatus Woesearchaeota archaeon]|nr:desulfoferrodoxin [Candidatus Woesearchaeota archaeon]
MVQVKELNQVYKCSVCGNVVETVHVGGGELVCCNKPMELLEANSTDAAQEKHVPVVEEEDDKIKVSVGTVPHPMTEEHFIEWIELISEGKAFRKYLKPGDEPVVHFCKSSSEATVRAYCNLHGLWKSS